MGRGWEELSHISVLHQRRFFSNFNLTSCFPLIPPLAHPDITHALTVWPLPPVFPREGEVNRSLNELRKELRAEQEHKVLGLIGLEYSSVVSSALEL